MATNTRQFNILNPCDLITSLDLGAGSTPITNVTPEYLAANVSGTFSLVDNSAGVPVLLAEVDTTVVVDPIAWMKQIRTDKEFGIQCEPVIGTQPTTPPWLKPKP